MSIDIADRGPDGFDSMRFGPAPSDDKRKSILTAARECIAENGLDGTSIAKIAQRAGVSKSLVLYHFGTKQSLAAAAWETALADVGDQVTSLVGSQQGFDRLEADFRVMFPTLSTNVPPPNFWLEFWAQASRDEALRQQHLARFQTTRKHYEHAIRHEMKETKAELAIDASLLADALATLSLGFEVRVSLDHESMPQERAFQSTKQVLDLLRLLFQLNAP